jgi:hypothetical protein
MLVRPPALSFRRKVKNLLGGVAGNFMDPNIYRSRQVGQASRLGFDFRGKLPNERAVYST